MHTSQRLAKFPPEPHSGLPVRRAAVLGAGAWGTALAIALARQGLRVRLWSRREAHAEAMCAERENRERLAGHSLPKGVDPTASIEIAARDAEIVLIATSSSAAEQVAQAAACYVAAHVPAILCAKGLARDGKLLAAGVEAHWRGGVMVLSGPSFADEVAGDLPTVMALAGAMPLAARVAEQLSSDSFVLCPTADAVGVQVAAVFKNVAAILCGAGDALEFGANARAALMSEAMREAATLVIALGGEAQTLLGPAGFGDFALTCTDAKSRNYSFGRHLAEGVSEMSARSTREGAANVEALVRLARGARVETPLAAAVAELIAGRTDARAAIETTFASRRSRAGKLARAA